MHFFSVAEDESYNEAAQTLLTIGNLTHLSQSAPSETATQDHTTCKTQNVFLIISGLHLFYVKLQSKLKCAIMLNCRDSRKCERKQSRICTEAC